MRATTGLLDMGLREYFDTSVREAMSHQKVEATGETVVYLVGMMAGFVEAERVFETTDDGVVLQPLTGLYQQAIEAPSPEARNDCPLYTSDAAHDLLCVDLRCRRYLKHKNTRCCPRTSPTLTMSLHCTEH